MSGGKYIGLDVHQATICAARNFVGTFEEGTWAVWFYDLLKPRVANLVVCNPRKIALLQHGNKSDKIDAHKLADRLHLSDLESVYHDETGVRMLRELARSYLTIARRPTCHLIFRLRQSGGPYIPVCYPEAGWIVALARARRWMISAPHAAQRMRRRKHHSDTVSRRTEGWSSNQRPCPPESGRNPHD